MGGVAMLAAYLDNAAENREEVSSTRVINCFL